MVSWCWFWLIVVDYCGAVVVVVTAVGCVSLPTGKEAHVWSWEMRRVFFFWRKPDKVWFIWPTVHQPGEWKWISLASPTSFDDQDVSWCFVCFEKGIPQSTVATHSSWRWATWWMVITKCWTHWICSGSIRPGRPNKDVSSSMCFIFHR